MFREIILPIFRSTRLCVTACGVMHPSRCCRPKATGIINKPLLLHLVGCLYYLYQWCTVKQVSDNKIYLLIEYIKSVLWRVVTRLSYIQDARCLRLTFLHILCMVSPRPLSPTFSLSWFRVTSSLHPHNLVLKSYTYKILKAMCNSWFCVRLWMLPMVRTALHLLAVQFRKMCDCLKLLGGQPKSL